MAPVSCPPGGTSGSAGGHERRKVLRPRSTPSPKHPRSPAVFCLRLSWKRGKILALSLSAAPVFRRQP